MAPVTFRRLSMKPLLQRRVLEFRRHACTCKEIAERRHACVCMYACMYVCMWIGRWVGRQVGRQAWMLWMHACVSLPCLHVRTPCMRHLKPSLVCKKARPFGACVGEITPLDTRYDNSSIDGCMLVYASQKVTRRKVFVCPYANMCK